MPGALAYNAIVLAGGDDRRLHPLTSSSVKALMPVANKPLLSYALKSLQDAGLPKVFVVRAGPVRAAWRRHRASWGSRGWIGPQSSPAHHHLVLARAGGDGR